MIRTGAACALVLALAVPARAADDTPLPIVKLFSELTVHCDGLTGTGTVHVGLYDEATFPETHPLLAMDARVAGATATAVFPRLPPGRYAIKAFLDRNGNGVRDQGEPQALSRGGTDFDSAVIIIDPGDNTAVLHFAR